VIGEEGGVVSGKFSRRGGGGGEQGSEKHGSGRLSERSQRPGAIDMSSNNRLHLPATPRLVNLRSSSELTPAKW
jgi:hypothetical protein